MALIKCPDCGKEVSDASATCVGCGRPIGKAKRSRKGEATLSVLLGIGSCWLWIGAHTYLIFPHDTLIFGLVLLASGTILFAKS